jgi:hypothetical protein
VSAVTSAPAPAPVRSGVVAGRGGEVVQWLAPAPLWDEVAVSADNADIAQPWIAELTSDQFVDQFLAMVGATDGSTPDQLAGTAPEISLSDQSGAPYKLFHPLSQRYYVVSASLVCRRPGIPDHQVRPRAGEKTTYVMRQLADDGSELAYVPAKGAALTPGAPATGSWVAATATALVTGEKQYPLHAAPVAGFAATGSTAAVLGMASGETSTRTIHFGYLPVGGREKLVAPIADPVATLKAFGQQPGNPAEDPFVDELVGRVVQPWAAQRTAPLSSKSPTYPSLYLLLDLLDWTKKYLPKLYAAIIAGSAPSSTDLPHQAALFAQLQDVTIFKNGSTMTLDAALAEVEPYLALVTSNDIAGPTGAAYDLTHASKGSPGLGSWLDPTYFNGLAAQAQSALGESTADPEDPPLGVPPELQGLIKTDPVTLPPGASVQTFVIRTVFEHDPCCPVLSPPSHAFVLARPIDADAPARKIRIQLPDVANLRSFNRGVALEMPPSLRRVINAVTPDALKGDIDPSGGLQLGMICSFSLQIIFLCAFIVLFIFLLLLNIVFWWMPFLKICFPIPVKPSTPKGPTP